MKLRYIILLITIFLWQCTERIEVELDPGYTRLVVDGNVNTDLKKHRVRLTRTSDYFFNEEAPPVEDASVYIDDGTRVYPMVEIDSLPGWYETEEVFAGKPGRTYTLYIEGVDVDRDGATESYSASSAMEPVNPIDSIRLKYYDSFFKGYSVAVYAQDPPEKNYYLFRVYRNSVLLTDSLHEFIVQEDVLFNGNYTNGIEAQFLDFDEAGERVVPGDTVTFEINGINRDYFRFVVEAQLELYRAGPYFTGPPANISTNVSGDGIGFFVAYSINRASTIVPPLE